MKKRLIALILLVCVLTLPLIFTACSNNSTPPTLLSITAELTEDFVYKKGDAFSTSNVVLTAYFSDNSSTPIQASQCYFHYEEVEEIFNNLTDLEFNDKATEEKVRIRITFLEPMYEFFLEFDVAD